ncbi:mitogen-activated protein kinase 7 isoform X2 [Aricia agestis]|uniref:mitogen-activated protein kinase 7 isoform X2 n=1 Tax=Aricia agestis TaxID=91739 RepID=UPI001C20BA33|nr:mitogen-activated protein kinase 7 isoform X2 [Aricia agestis]
MAPKYLRDFIFHQSSLTNSSTESRSVCGGGSEGGEGRAWRVTLDHDLVETLSAIYPEWFKQPRRDRPPPASPPSPVTPATPVTPVTPQTSDNDIFSSGAEEMASGQGSSGASEPPSSPRPSPPKVVVDDSPLQPAMGKHKESLKVKLMMRRPINELVEQGIMPPLKTPPTYFKQLTSLNRAKTGDILKAKIQRRPARDELERRHILEQECHVDPSLAERQRMLKKAILADQLNDQLSHRPGPLELIQKNILHTEENIESAVKSGTVAFKATSEGASARPPHPSSYCGPPDDASPSPSPPAAPPAPHPAQHPAQHPAPGKDKKSRCKKTKPCRSRFKFHEYKGPPSAQKAPSPPDAAETPYDLLLQQQQLLLQLMWPPSPAASVASDSSDPAAPAPSQPPPPAARYEDMRVPDLRAECKRRNLPVSGPKTQLIDRLRLNSDVKDEPPRSPMSVASPESRADSEQADDIVQSQSQQIGEQSRQIRELKRQLEDLRRQLEAARRDAAGHAAGAQSRRLLQKHLHITQLQAQIEAHERRSRPAAPPAPQYVLAAPAADAARDRYVRVVAVASPPGADLRPDAAPGAANTALLLNGGEIKIVPIALVSSTPFEPERAAPVPPPPPPPPMPPAPREAPPPATDASLNEEIEDVLEIIAKSGELPTGGAGCVSTDSLDSGFPGGADFAPADILGGSLLSYSPAGDALAAESAQRELNAIRDDILGQAEFDTPSGQNDERGLDADLSVERLLAGDEFDATFAGPASPGRDDLYDIFAACDAAPAMDVDDEPPERMSTTPGVADLPDHTRMGFDDMADLVFPAPDSPNGYGGADFDLRQFGLDTMCMDGDPYDTYTSGVEPNRFSRSNMQQSDPVMGAVLARPAPRPMHKHYSWDKIEYGDAT